MKINERNLISFSTCDSPIDRDGYLLKRGEVNKSFQKRWCVLKGNLLFYFDKKTDKEPIGVIILEGCTVELAENDEQYTFKVVFHGSGNRTYIFCAENQETMEGWMKGLACASYDYVKLMVAELQRQLDELTEAERLSARSNSQGNLSDGLRRMNPFDRHKYHMDNSGELVPVAGNIPSTSLASESVAKGDGARKKFIDLHQRYGERIQRDLKKWKDGEIGKRNAGNKII